MTVAAKRPWTVGSNDPSTIHRLAQIHEPDPLALELRVDIVADLTGRTTTATCGLCSERRVTTDVAPGSAVVIGSPAGRWLARVLAWDFEVDAGTRS